MQLSNWRTAFCFVLFAYALPAAAVDITISCGAVGQERELCEAGVKEWAAQTGNTVTIYSPQQETNQRYFEYLITLGDHDDSIDVYQIDVIWPGLLAKHFVDLREYIDEQTIAQHFPAIIKNNTVEGRLVGMPWYTDVGLLYYRKDLLDKYGLSAPQTWAELADTALYIQSQERSTGNEQLWGLVFQGARYEGLTCDALEWISSAGGGTIIDPDGTITVNNPQAVYAVARAASWVGSLAPKRVISFIEEDARIMFQLGEAVFMRNWPYAWSLLNGDDSAVAGKVEVAPLPQGGPGKHPTGTLGGWQLAVSKYSKHPQEAADLVKYLTSADVQKRRAIVGSYLPTIVSLYEDAEVLQANPFFAKLPPLVENAVVRPSSTVGDDYMAVTTYFWEAVHDVLQGSKTAGDSLASLENQLRLVKTRGGW